MIKIHFTSGLGNQLFQFFFGEAIKLKFPNNDVKYINSLQRPYQVNLNHIFEIEKKSIDLNSNNKNYFSQIIKYLRIRFYKIIIKLNINKYFKIYSDNSLNNDLSFFSNNKFNNINLYGYWQNYEYFQNYFDQIKTKLIFKKKIKLKNHNIFKDYSNVIGVHVRGGDYRDAKNLKIFNQTTREFYISSMNKFNLFLKKPIFIFFTDDYKFLNDLMLDIKFSHAFINDLFNNRDDDFQLLSQCDHFIIPNSTFSLWAAYLSQSHNKFIISPTTWLKKNEFNYKFLNYDWIKKL